MDWNDDNYDILTSYFIANIKKLPKKGEYTLKGEDGRPDLISKAIYRGDSQYWWILLLYNDILDTCELITGLDIIYPSQDSIEDLFLSLRKREVSRRSR